MAILKKEIKLNPRQWAIYNVIKKINEQFESVWTSKEAIVRALPDYFNQKEIDEIGWNEHSSTNYHIIRKDIKIINTCPVIQKPIISSSYGYKIPTKEEYEKWSTCQWNAIKGRILRQKQKDYKALLDGQSRLVEDGTSQKPVIESFIDSIK